MYSQPQKPEISLHIPPQIWQAFRHAMLNSQKNNTEVIGFLFCQRSSVCKRKIRYFPRIWVVPSSDCYEYQAPNGLILKQYFHLYLLKTYLSQKGFHIVHIHTHPGEEIPHFSNIDDQHESHYARFLTTHFRQKPRLISGVFDKSLQQGQFRIWDRQGESYSFINCYRSWFEIENKFSSQNDDNLMFSRQQIFGNSLQIQLTQLKVTLIGCGGIGASFAELLGRLGVKHWLLIDPDRLETVNLNRMPGATQKMVEKKVYKVQYVKGLLKNIYQTGSCIKAFKTEIQNSSIYREIAASDLIVVATDNHHSRQIAQELALLYMRPLVCLGTHIEIQADKTPRLYCRITVPPLGGGWCLMCGNIINLQQSALEAAPSDIHHLAANTGYLENISNPAVFWLNSICASTAVGIIQGMISGFLKIEKGIDWIYHFPASDWLKTDVSYLETPGCYFCSH